jgi:hypothetical protein
MARLQVILCQPSLEYPSFVSLWAMLSNAEQDGDFHRVVQGKYFVFENCYFRLNSHAGEADEVPDRTDRNRG